MVSRSVEGSRSLFIFDQAQMRMLNTTFCSPTLSDIRDLNVRQGFRGSSHGPVFCIVLFHMSAYSFSCRCAIDPFGCREALGRS